MVDLIMCQPQLREVKGEKDGASELCDKLSSGSGAELQERVRQPSVIASLDICNN